MATATTFLKLLKAAKAEKYSVDMTNKNLDDIDMAYDKLPKGIIKFLDDTTKSPGLSGTAIVNNMLSNITLVKGRTYTINYRCDVNTTASNMAVVVNFRHGPGSAPGGTNLGHNTTYNTSPVVNQGKTVTASVTWKQELDGVNNIKAESARLTTTALYSIENRHLELIDMGII